ncbi:MAG: Hsp20/alpha crystallin family protein [Leptospiraceae bacterium]|nr:Hsp20/alpha crystallin family protein [Leptospiraceae bacterium]MCB1317863.1 Hsp20/alpha crystallin family protein [Leptospiraceae bacterium]MCB1318790.1 Hsp20/alpha crystallin family protein [Leptospiraceae bacterium]
MRSLSHYRVPGLLRVFDDLNHELQNGNGNVYIPDVQIEKNDTTYRVTAALPGVAKEAVNVEVENGQVKISGTYPEVAESDFKTVYTEKQRYTRFERNLRIDENKFDVEKVDARLENGVLCITLPLKENLQPRQIKIN